MSWSVVLDSLTDSDWSRVLFADRAGQELHLCFESAAESYQGKYGQLSRPHSRTAHPYSTARASLCAAASCAGTSMDLRYCLDPRNDALVALQQNDEPLTADHGHPV